MKRANINTGSLTTVGLFAGIGGIEAGLQRAGHKTQLLCEIDEGASRVLAHHFPRVPLARDIRTLESLPKTDVLAGGFPCQDLSQAGRTAGIRGKNSGLIDHVFRLLDARRHGPSWLFLENVSFMLHLDRGNAMRVLVDHLEARGYTWAYRIVDTRAFGLPQRRQRVILIASKTEDPRGVVFADEATPKEPTFSKRLLCGFYWTEGLRGLGWAVDGVPTLKGGSTIGIPSPPAIWNPRTGAVSTPEIRDAERLQGFDVDWTLPALSSGSVRKGHRWKLVGNAVSVPVAQWVGERLASPGRIERHLTGVRVDRGEAWPKAAWGHKGKVHHVDCSMWPVDRCAPHLSEFLRHALSPLSVRAAAGFKSRADVSGLSFVDGFLEDVQRHIDRSISAAVA
jgi:DNA (cytosine-5)-methyltransferase 1